MCSLFHSWGLGLANETTHYQNRKTEMEKRIVPVECPTMLSLLTDEYIHTYLEMKRKEGCG